MIGIGISPLFKRGGGGVDPDVTAYLSELTGTISQGFINDITTLIGTLKLDNNWLFDCFQIFATENRQNATVSLQNPSRAKAEEFNSVTWTQNIGYNSNVSMGFVKSKFTPSINAVNYLLNNSSFFVYILDDSSGVYSEIGSGESGSINTLFAKFGGSSIRSYINSNINTDSSNTNSSGFYQIVRTSSGIDKIYRNGILISSGTATSSFLPTVEQYYLCANWFGSANLFSDRRVALAGFGSGSINPFTFYSAIQTFAISRGFNV
jgi:hypothetical protein